MARKMARKKTPGKPAKRSTAVRQQARILEKKIKSSKRKATSIKAGKRAKEVAAGKAVTAGRQRDTVPESDVTQRAKFARKLTELRTNAKLSTTDLANKAQVSKTVVYDLEGARTAAPPGLKTVKALDVALDQAGEFTAFYCEVIKQDWV